MTSVKLQHWGSVMSSTATELICSEDRYAHKYFSGVLHHGQHSGPGQDAGSANTPTLHFRAQLLLFPPERQLLLFSTTVSSSTRQHRLSKFHSELTMP